jgi:hypothetical protein
MLIIYGLNTWKFTSKVLEVAIEPQTIAVMPNINGFKSWITSLEERDIELKST